ncbi:MAG: hypothetical protein EP298_05345 [Gammaproteobacteria bacterium]|nr:MAG: hypothetical protein EP298_05345 [Gammaproteobacteria bacterium]UTW42452.1 hypothetical protein KFE69_13410 [bacterium SCSIO 12844]
MKSIPYYLFRGGTSKGAFFFKKDLPKNEKARNTIISKIMGSPHPYQVDGIGGGVPNASKIGILSPSKKKGVDLEYIMGQVDINSMEVDTHGDCGNMLTAAACCAIEANIVKVQPNYTQVTIYSPKTDSIKRVCVPIKNSKIIYEGSYHIDGVKPLGSPMTVSFYQPSASQTKAIFPSTKKIDIIDNIPVTLIDCGRALIIAKASDFGLTGNEEISLLEKDKDLNQQLEAFRLQCADRMGISNPCVSFPRITLISKGKSNQDIFAHYWSNPKHAKVHPAMAMTAAMAIGSCLCIDGTICYTEKHKLHPTLSEQSICIGHAQGEVTIKVTAKIAPLMIQSCSFKRTARLLASGMVYYT